MKNNSKTRPTAEDYKQYILKNFACDISTGFIYRKSNNRVLGAYDYSTNYISICININNYIKKFYAHKIVWLFAMGEFPKAQIDHINLITTDNSILNLRTADRYQNQHNTAKRANNKSGKKGVWWNKGARKWASRIRFHNKLYDLGYFSDIDSAYKAYCKKSYELQGEYCPEFIKKELGIVKLKAQSSEYQQQWEAMLVQLLRQ